MVIFLNNLPDNQFSLLHIKEKDSYHQLNILNLLAVNEYPLKDRITGDIVINCKDDTNNDVIQVINTSDKKCKTYFKK